MGTKKEFILQVVEEIKENPRAPFTGHKIDAKVLQTIVEREDVMAKLATFLYSMKTAKKGAKGLARANNFKLTGYKTFGTLADLAREDVENFITALPAEDQATFTNSDNIAVILLEPQAAATGEETVESSIISGKSVMLTFDKAVDKKYGAPGSMYLTVMIGDSAIRQSEIQVAERKEKVNKKKQSRRTPAVVRAEIKAKAAKKIAALDAKRLSLQEVAYNTSMEMEQFANVRAQKFGLRGTGAKSLDDAKRFNNNVAKQNAYIENLPADEKRLFNLAVNYKKAGKMQMANAMMAELGNNPILVKALANGGVVADANTILLGRRDELKSKIKQLTRANEQLLVDMALAPSVGTKNGIKAKIRKNSALIREYRAKLGTYKNISGEGLRNKARILKETNAAIQANIAQGATIQQALNSAIAEMSASPAQKQIIKQQIIQQVANGVPPQFAVQQAVQNNIVDGPVVGNQFANQFAIDDEEEFLGNTTLSGSSDIEDVLNSII